MFEFNKETDLDAFLFQTNLVEQSTPTCQTNLEEALELVLDSMKAKSSLLLAHRAVLGLDIHRLTPLSPTSPIPRVVQTQK